MGIFDRLKTKIAYHEIDKQIERKEAERALVNEAADLTPPIYNDLKRKYHYKDVNIRVRWEYCGRYGKSCKSIGMKCGDVLQLLPPQDPTEELSSVAIVWHGMEIGYMKTNRLQDMVLSWQSAQLPVLAIVSMVGGEEKLYIEFAFYGTPPKKA